MAVHVIHKEEAKPKQFDSLESFTTYQIITNTKDQKQLVGDIVIKLTGERGYPTALLDCTTGKLINNDDVKYLQFLRDFTIRAIQLVYDETDRPK